MDDMLTLSKSLKPDEIRTQIADWCLYRDTDDIEDGGFFAGLKLREDAYKFNPCRPGTLDYESYEIGVSLAVDPWIYEPPEPCHSEPTPNSEPYQPDLFVTLHSPVMVSLIAGCVTAIAYVLMNAPMF
jgi:hypothetical protein